jgi:Mce-associated membrane protein
MMPPRGFPAEADELAQIEARAQAARAHATRLRQQAEAASSDEGTPPGADETEPAPSRRRRLRPSGRTAVAAAAVVLVVGTALAASASIIWHHRAVDRQKQRAAEFATAARNGVVLMLSMDPNTARNDMQRFADDTTGLFKAGILMGAEDAVKAMERSKAASKGFVQATAVDSMTDDSAIVLVAAKAESTKPGQAKPDSRPLRLVVSVQREGGQLKISRVEFVQ